MVCVPGTQSDSQKAADQGAGAGALRHGPSQQILSTDTVSYAITQLGFFRFIFYYHKNLKKERNLLKGNSVLGLNFFFRATSGEDFPSLRTVTVPFLNFVIFFATVPVQRFCYFSEKFLCRSVHLSLYGLSCTFTVFRIFCFC